MDQQRQGSSPPRSWRRRVGALLGTCAIIGAAACADAPTAVEPAGSTAAPERSAARGGGGTVEVVCSISYAAHEGPYAYRYGRITVKLPAASRAADGSTRQYRFRNHAGSKVVGAANCTIPATERAAAHLDRFFGARERGGRRVERSGEATLMGDDFMLPPLVVNACQYGGEWPYCDPEPINWEAIGTPPQEQQICHFDCGGGGSTGGGSTSEPPADEDDDLLSLAPPDCSNPQTLRVGEQAYCAGTQPAGVRLNRVNDALGRMELRGEECRALADRARALLVQGHVRIYSNAGQYRGGYAPLGGDWIALDSRWVDLFHSSLSGDGRNLDHALAHELDHILGRHHLINPDGTEDKYNTPNSRHCAGLA